MEYDDCTTYSEKLAVSHFEITDIMHRMFNDFKIACEHPSEFSKSKAIQVEAYLDDMEDITDEGFDLFVHLIDD